MIVCVLGAPCSGKSTWVANRAEAGEVRADFTRLATALGAGTDHDPSDDAKAAAFVAHHAAIGRIFEGLDGDAYITRRSMAADSITEYGEAGVRFVVLDPGMDVCLARAAADDRPDGTEDDIRAWYDDPPDVPDEFLLEDSTDDRQSRHRIGQPSSRHSPRTRQEQNPMSRNQMPYGAQNLPRAAAKDWYRIRAEATEPSVADVYIYDAIDSWFGVSAESLVQDLARLDVEQLNVFINSPGGSVFDGLAILNALRRHSANVTITVDGLAASAASFIAMGGDEIVMSRNAELMIHDAAGICIGNAGDMLTMAEDLTRVSDNLASIYAERAGGDIKAWRDVMIAETWYTAQEAVDAGLADRIDNGKDGTKAKAKFDLDIFAHAGRADAPSPYIPRTAVAAAGPGPAEQSVTPHQEGTDMSDLIKGLRNRLGIPAGAELTDEQLLAAVDEALEERAESTSPPEQTTPAERALPDGTEVIDSEVLAQLRADAEDGRAARAEQDKARREQIVNDAIKAGKFGPARRDAWLNALEVDEAGAIADLERLSPGLVPVNQLGDAGEVDADEDLYNRAFGATQKDVK